MIPGAVRIGGNRRADDSEVGTVQIGERPSAVVFQARRLQQEMPPLIEAELAPVGHDSSTASLVANLALRISL